MRVLIAVVIATLAGCGGERVFFEIDPSGMPPGARITHYQLILANPAVVAQRQKFFDGNVDNPVTRDVFYVAQRYAFRLAPDELQVEVVAPEFAYTPIVVAFDDTRIVAFGALAPDALFPEGLVEDDAEHPVPAVEPLDDVTIYDLPLQPVEDVVSAQSTYVFVNDSAMAYTCPSRDPAAGASALIWHRHAGQQLRIVLPLDGEPHDAKARLHHGDGVDLDCDAHTPDQVRRADDRDCDDLDDREFGVKTEVCNGLDDDCDGKPLGLVVMPCNGTAACGGVGVCNDANSDGAVCAEVAGPCPACEVPLDVNGTGCTAAGIVPLPGCFDGCRVTLVDPANGSVEIGRDESDRNGANDAVELHDDEQLHVFIASTHPTSFTLYVEPEHGPAYVHTRKLVNAAAGVCGVRPVLCHPTPVPLTELDTFGYIVEDPSATADLKELYFTRRNANNEAELMVAKRLQRNEPWGAPEPLFGATAGAHRETPEVSPDGLALTFATKRGGSENILDVYKMTRASRTAPWGMPALVDGFDPEASQFSAVAVAGGYVFTTPGQGGLEVHRLVQIGTSEPIIRGPSNNANAWVSADGLTAVFDSDRAGGAGGTDLWRGTITGTGVDAFESLPWLNSPANESDPWVSPDGKTILFASDRGQRGFQIYEARAP